MTITFKGYRSNYELFIDGEGFHKDTDFTVGDGDEYDFTVEECVEADMAEIEERFGVLDAESREEIVDKLEFYYAGHNN